jgi:nucleoside-diphosphate-sugar epimerase
MRVLITGANGFIAREIIARLFQSGHEIVACVHSKLLENVPHTRAFTADFTKSTELEFWLPHLHDIDVVINCVGVFQTVQDKNMWKIHYEAPKALFEACVKKNIKKIIHISILGADKVDVPYATSKLAIDNYLQTLSIDSTIIRPSVVYGKGSYGGTSLFRGLAGFPLILPLPGRAEQLQQPIHIDDLALIVERALTLPGKQLWHAVGEEKISIKNMLIKLRTWLGFKKAKIFSIPESLLRLGAKIGNYIPNSPMSETGIKMMTVDIVATEQELENLKQATQINPRGYTDGLKGMVSSVQDRWHARLYFLRPLLRISIAFIFLLSGILCLLPTTFPLSMDFMMRAHIPLVFRPAILYICSGIDIILGLATLLNYRLIVVGFMQCAIILIYTLVLSILFPMYWLDPLGALAKNIPILAAILAMMALESER